MAMVDNDSGIAGAGEASRDDMSFQRHEAAGFDLWFDAGTLKLPDELHLEAKGRRKKRVAAYWDGCVFAV